MKRRIALFVAAAALLAAAAGCELYTGINVGWNVDSVAPNGGTARVAYTVQNLGQYDLTGVNLQIGVDTNAGFYYTAWTSDFSLAKGQVVHRTIDVPTNGLPPVGATVLAIDMDKPGA